jgi:hypothetical protein
MWPSFFPLYFLYIWALFFMFAATARRSLSAVARFSFPWAPVGGPSLVFGLTAELPPPVSFSRSQIHVRVLVRRPVICSRRQSTSLIFSSCTGIGAGLRSCVASARIDFPWPLSVPRTGKICFYFVLLGLVSVPPLFCRAWLPAREGFARPDRCSHRSQPAFCVSREICHLGFTA